MRLWRIGDCYVSKKGGYYTKAGWPFDVVPIQTDDMCIVTGLPNTVDIYCTMIHMDGRKFRVYSYEYDGFRHIDDVDR